MVEAHVPTGAMIILIIIAMVCLASGQWLGAIGSALGAQQAWSTRYFLLKWKPQAAVE